MEERYLRQVKRVLCLPGKRKEEVVRDLREAFASAKENGEPAEAVIERLGSPEDFAGGIHEQLGIDAAAKRRRGTRSPGRCCCCWRRRPGWCCGCPGRCGRRKT